MDETAKRNTLYIACFDFKIKINLSQYLKKKSVFRHSFTEPRISFTYRSLDFAQPLTDCVTRRFYNWILLPAYLNTHKTNDPLLRATLIMVIMFFFIFLFVLIESIKRGL